MWLLSSSYSPPPPSSPSPYSPKLVAAGGMEVRNDIQSNKLEK
jgi:hypothetical protein